VRILTQDSAAGSYFEGDESRIHSLWFLIDILNHLIFLEIQAGLFASDFSTNVSVNVFSLSHMLCFAHLILPYFVTLCVFEELVMQFDWAVLAHRIKYWKEKFHGRRLVGRPRLRWVDNIKRNSTVLNMCGWRK